MTFATPVKAMDEGFSHIGINYPLLITRKLKLAYETMRVSG